MSPPPGAHRSWWGVRPQTVTLLAVLAATAGCGEETQAPASSAPDAALTTAGTTLSFRELGAGFLHSCGVTTGNRGYCWGWNVFGQIGNGTTGYAHPGLALVAGKLQFLQISAGWYSTCGVTTEKKAYCWGNHQLTPLIVPGGHLFRQLSVGPEHTCGVTTDDRAFCWGENFIGQLGNGTTGNIGNPTLTPVAVAGTLRFRAVSVGAYHSCGVTTTDRAYCWGGDQWGQIGDGPGSDSCPVSFNSLSCRKKPTLVAGGYRFRQVAAGGGHGPGEDGVGGDDGGRTCGLTTDERAFCWGDGRHGQNGDGTQSIRLSPSLVAGGLHFRGISAGVHHTCGVTTDDHGYCWGWNVFGQIGDGTLTMRLKPKAVAGGLQFRQVSVGGAHSCGTTLGNVAYCWGSNDTGALGDGTRTDRLKPRAVVE